MTFAQCQADAARLKEALQDWGVRASIELQAGRGTDPWLSARKYLRMHHHTVSQWCPTCALTPVLAIVKNGRPDVPGPLANGYGGYDGIYRILCMGLANHPGDGGPVTIDGVTVPRNSAREPTWGTEWEGGLQAWPDIRIPAYPGGMLEFMGRADNAIAQWSGRPLTSQLEHSTWAPTRKIDRLNFTRALGIALTNQYAAAPPPPEDDDIMFMHASNFTGVSLIEGGIATWLSTGASVDELRSQGVPTKIMNANESDARRFIRDRMSPVDIAAAEKASNDELLAVGKAIEETLKHLADLLGENPEPLPEPPPFPT